MGGVVNLNETNKLDLKVVWIPYSKSAYFCLWRKALEFFGCLLSIDLGLGQW